MTNFNNTPDRRKNINITKWSYYGKDVLPMWVADMDWIVSLAPMRDGMIVAYKK